MKYVYTVRASVVATTLSGRAVGDVVKIEVFRFIQEMTEYRTDIEFTCSILLHKAAPAIAKQLPVELLIQIVSIRSTEGWTVDQWVEFGNQLDEQFGMIPLQRIEPEDLRPY